LRRGVRKGPPAFKLRARMSMAARRAVGGSALGSEWIFLRSRGESAGGSEELNRGLGPR
jgi:hypothetical protein